MRDSTKNKIRYALRQVFGFLAYLSVYSLFIVIVMNILLKLSLGLLVGILFLTFCLSITLIQYYNNTITIWWKNANTQDATTRRYFT